MLLQPQNCSINGKVKTQALWVYEPYAVCAPPPTEKSSLVPGVLGVGACGAFGHRLCEPCLPLGH